MADAAPDLSQADRIDSICDRFEQDFLAGKKPAIERCLGESQDPFRSTLLRALVGLEIELRQKRGERPRVEDFASRFPNHTATIQQVFKESRSILSSVKVADVETSEGPVAKSKTTPDSRPLKKLGRFEILSVLGEGAFGTVYKAHDPQLDRDVAVKVPRSGMLQSSADRERFLREARAAAGLHHAQICPVHEVGTIDGRDYIVMAFIDGKPMSKVIQTQSRLTDKQIVSVVRKIALGLQEAHEKGIIHRDLKPANIMINRKGEPVIMDFGLARRENSGDAQISQSGQIMGTPAYMSPEQARGDGKSVGPTADIYSLGIILYELLCGRRPFEGTITEVIGAILHVDIDPPSKHRSGVDSRLQEICMKAIAKKSADRFQSMGDFAAALIEFLRTSSTSQPKSSSTVKESIEQDEALHTHEFARLMAAVSSDLEGKVERAASRAVRKARKKQKVQIPWWTYLVGSGLIGVIVLCGILFFIRKDTVTVIVNIPIENKNDPALSFFLDKKSIAVSAFDAPIELKPGEHELVVNKYDTLFRRFLFSVGKANEKVTVEDVTPKPEVVESKPQVEAKPPVEPGWIELFNGKDLSNWVSVDNQPPGWKVENGYMEIVPGTKSIFTRDNFPLDFQLHIEFWFPKDLSKNDQRRSNSGIYLLGRHEIQLCDSFENPISAPKTACGAMYGEIAPTSNPATAPETWQTFDIDFRGPRVDGQKKVTTPGQLSLTYNGVNVIDKVSFSTIGSNMRQNDNAGQPGPIFLQDHGSIVRFRNIRIRPTTKTLSIPRDASIFQGHSYKFYAEQLKWTDAKMKCEALGGHLLIVESAAENAFAAKLVEAANWVDAWIGATDQDQEGDWKTVIGGPLPYLNWGPGQPNNKPPGEHYALMSNMQVGAEKLNWVWSDQPNESHQHKPGYLCEWDALPEGRIDDANAAVPLFNGKDLTGWQGNPAFWTVQDGVLVGKLPPGKQDSYSYLITQQPYRDFELKVVAKLIGQNSGIQIRSSIVNPQTFDMAGPQIEIAPSDQIIWGTIVTSPSHQPSVVAQVDKAKQVLRANDFNELVIVCVGKHVTVTLNGAVVNDTDFPTMPPDGLIGLQLHKNFPGMEIQFREITIHPR